MARNLIKWTIIVFAGIFIISCAPTKEHAYFKEYKSVPGINQPDKVYSIEHDSLYYISKGDELYITVVSGNAEPNSFNQTTRTSSQGSELVGYTLDNEGYIRLPYVKQIKAEGLTISQLTVLLENELSQYIYLPSVTIRIINKRITILGEVNRPGVYQINKNTLNIYQAIAQAGDVASFGNRKNVLIIRNDGSKIIKKYVDLTNDEIMLSSWFLLQSEDIIYVEPLGRKRYGMQTFSIVSFLSLVSSSFALYLLIKNNGI